MNFPEGANKSVPSHNLPGVILVTTDMRSHLSVDGDVLGVTGYTADEFVALDHMRDFLSPKADRVKLASIAVAMMDPTQAFVEVDIPYIHKDGHTIWLRVCQGTRVVGTTANGRPKAMLVFSDVTAKAQRETVTETWTEDDSELRAAETGTPLTVLSKKAAMTNRLARPVQQTSGSSPGKPNERSTELIIESKAVVGIRGEKSDVHTVVVPAGVEEIKGRTFRAYRCLISLTLPESLTAVGTSAFRACSGLTSVTLPNGLTSVGSYSFSDCSGLTSITFPSTLDRISNAVCRGCSVLTSLTLPDSCTIIGDSAFSGCSGLTSLTLPSNLTTIGRSAFRGCGRVISLTFPKTVTSVGSEAFYACAKLTSITLPRTLTNIGDSSFYSCFLITSIVVLPTWPLAAFIAWAVGNSRNRNNWQVTTVRYLRNVLRLVTAFLLERRNEVDVGMKASIFRYCPSRVLKSIQYDVDGNMTLDSMISPR